VDCGETPIFPAPIMYGTARVFHDPNRPASSVLLASGQGSNYAQLRQRVTRPLSHSVPQLHPLFFSRTISSVTVSYTERRSFMRLPILSTAWITVVWSRPPNSRPMAG
jgi:hypothetical protein